MQRILDLLHEVKRMNSQEPDISRIDEFAENTSNSNGPRLKRSDLVKAKRKQIRGLKTSCMEPHEINHLTF